MSGINAMSHISVCMATYNGEKYIVQQLSSILSQLNAEDELIVSDDSSTDATLALVREMNDPRIRIFPGNQFHSPIYNFEFCLTKASGDIILLSDQDDIWLPGKVSTIMEIFSNDPDVTLVASDAQIINARGAMIAETFYPAGVKFTSSVLANIVKNRFLGCSLAIRRRILPVVLPFPRRLPMHDSWLGIMNLLFGKVHFIKTPLLAYRRHEANFSPPTRSQIIRILTWRWNLVIAILGRVWALHIRSYSAGNIRNVHR